MNSNELKDYIKSNIVERDQSVDLEYETSMLGFRFLSIVDEIMEEKNISKKELAERVGTSPSYITQLFRGSKIPNLNTLTKFQHALDFKFEISNRDKSSRSEKAEIRSYIEQNFGKDFFPVYHKPAYKTALKTENKDSTKCIPMYA